MISLSATPHAPSSLRTVACLLLLAVCFSSASAQDGARARGDSLRMAGDLTGAIDVYHHLLHRNGDEGDLAYLVASTFALQGQYPDSAFHYLDVALAEEDTMRSLWDSDLATRQRYLPLLEAACEQGEADWSRYAHILDRTELELGHAQVYGTQMELNEEAGRYEPQPIRDPEHVDERRAEKGLEPLDVQLTRFNESMQRDFGTSGGGG